MRPVGIQEAPPATPVWEWKLPLPVPRGSSLKENEWRLFLLGRIVRTGVQTRRRKRIVRLQKLVATSTGEELRYFKSYCPALPVAELAKDKI